MSGVHEQKTIEFLDFVKERQQHARDVSVQLDTLAKSDKRIKGVYFYLRDAFAEMSTIYSTMASMYEFMKLSDNLAFFLVKDFLGVDEKASIEDTQQRAKDFGQYYDRLVKIIEQKEAEDKEKEKYK